VRKQLTINRAGALLLLAILTVIVACGGDDDDSTLVVPTLDLTAADLDATSVPDIAYESDGGTLPRTYAYWAEWNSCAPDNRAAEAAANGGREAGWFLVDDFLADPGIQLGDHLLVSCEESLGLLFAADPAHPDPVPVPALAGQLLTAELNLATDAETCPIAEEAVLGSHIVLADLGFNGSSATNLNASDEITDAVPELTDLLIDYNSGQLCR
jgi:hypothetical protein